MTLKVRMHPNVTELGSGESGIHTVIRKYFQYLPDYDIDLVGPEDMDYDVLALHAGMMNKLPSGKPIVSILHGMYWTGDYQASRHEYIGNASIVNALHNSKEVTVPSSWVAETLQRDLRINPTVVPHGVDWEEWTVNPNPELAVLAYGKNRAYFDVCNPNFIPDLAKRFPEIKFYTTFAPRSLSYPENVIVTGVLPYAEFKALIQKVAVVMSPIKETWGVMTAEALAAGVPVLGTKRGGNLDIVQHGVDGYLYAEENLNDMAAGLEYCLTHRSILSENARHNVQRFSWSEGVKKLAQVFYRASQHPIPTVSVVIPYYKKPKEMLERAVLSVTSQTVPPSEIIIVDDGSENGIAQEVVKDNELLTSIPLYLVQKANSGVADTRNLGARTAIGEYLCFLDSDDAIAPKFLETCVAALEKDNALHLAYTRLLTCLPDGRQELSMWPGEWDFNSQLRRKNQVPTCNVMRSKTFFKLGGYRSRYCPAGAGTEDAHLWTMFGRHGYECRLVSQEPLFLYTYSQGTTAQAGYKEVDWLSLIPETQTAQHPFASFATPSLFSHPVREYDEPLISIIVPVGPGHEKYLRNLIETVEGQRFHKWELIVVNDSGQPFDPWLLTAFPFVKWMETPGKKGAGFARNRGVEKARGAFLLFLDADDNLVGNGALERFYNEYLINEGVIYSDYFAISVLNDPTELFKQVEADPHRQWVGWDEKHKEAVIRHNTANYDCELARRQPDFEKPYLWCNVTALIPIDYHRAIQGFDETMPSWEDWDYWLRMSHLGYCFYRITEPLLAYRFDTGHRREEGLKNYTQLLTYLKDKYTQVRYTMPCGCKDNKNTTFLLKNQQAISTTNTTVNKVENINDDDFVMAIYATRNIGQHMVIGASTRFSYGYRGGGDIFLVHKEDIKLQPHLFKCPETIESFVWGQDGRPRCSRPITEDLTAVQETPPPTLVK